MLIILALYVGSVCVSVYFTNFLIVRSWDLLVQHQYYYRVLEIKPCGLGSRIRDMEADIVEHFWPTWRLEAKHNTASAHFGTLAQCSVHPTAPKCVVAVCPLTDYMEVKNKYAYVIMQDICNKFIEVNFFVGCMVSQPNRLFQDWTSLDY